jgi:thiol reductant ABC exporter CydD subunit
VTDRLRPPRVVDRRLLGLGGPVRRFLPITICLGLASAAVVIARAVLLGRIVAGAFHGAGPTDLSAEIWGLLVLAAAAAGIGWGTETAAHRSAAGVISALRHRLVVAVFDARTSRIPHGRIAVAAGKGIEAVDGYFSRYLPNLVLAFLVPVAVVGSMIRLDPWSAVIVVMTLPLIPIFAALIGTATRLKVSRRWDALAALGVGVLEGLRALPMLKAFGRSSAQTADIAGLADSHRRETMGVLRIAFLSALALELAATISVAVVAVAVGLRVLDGGLGLEPAFIVLTLAPEAYLPLRRLAGDFHTATEAIEAVGRVFEIAPDSPEPETASKARPLGSAPEIVANGVGLRSPIGHEHVLDGIDLTIAPGTWAAVIGPSGVGKSTLLCVLAGLIPVDRGTVEVDGTAIGHDIVGWRARVGWMPQDPHLFPGTITDNVRFGNPEASREEVAQVLQEACAGFVFDLPAGIDTEIGERGILLSAGQRARIALARCLVRRPDALLLDEPTAHLDAVTEGAVLDMLAGLHGSVTIVLAAHRSSAAARADQTIRLAADRRAKTTP